jgi:hypothetical protein
MTFTLVPNGQIVPRNFYSEFNLTPGYIYLVIGSVSILHQTEFRRDSANARSQLGTPSGQGLDFVLGFAFLQRFYTVYDTRNSWIGFANTPYTDATTN